MAIDPVTFDFYTQRAPFHTHAFAANHSPPLNAFLDRLSVGARILELGCGSGQDAAQMRRRGFAVEATDGVPAVVRRANERFDLGARVMRFDELDAVDAYDAVWAHACLLHCPRAQLPAVLGAIHAALRAGGLHFASYKLGIGEGRDLLGRLHNFPAADWLLERYKQAGFALVDHRIYAGLSSDGTQRGWIDLTLARA